MSESASIYDLLKHEENPPRPTRRRTGIGWWTRTSLKAATLATVTVVGLRLLTIGVPWPAVFAGFFALFLLRRVTARLTPPAPRRTHPHRGDNTGHEGLHPWDTRDALPGAIRRWEIKLVWSQGERDRFVSGVLPALGDLVDERLRQRHGCTRATDPDRARDLLGDHLWNFLSTPARRSPSPREVAAVVAELEKL